MKRVNLYGALIAFLGFFLIGLITLSHYGMNWDEPVHYIRGQAYLHLFLTGKQNYNDLPKLKSHYPKYQGSIIPPGVVLQNDTSFRRSIYQYDGGYRGTFQWFLENDSGHPPLNGILASLFNTIFYQKLGIVGDIESYHLFIITVSALLVATVFLFTSTFFGLFAGFVSALSLILYPLFFSESHFNVKDPVEMAFYALTAITLYLGVTKKSWKWILLCALFSGLALGTKFNIVFLILTVVPWFLIYKWDSLRRFKWDLPPAATVAIVTIPLVSLFILFSTWPFLWRNPISNFLSIASYYKTIGEVSYQVNDHVIKNGINTYTLQWILYTTPLITLFFGFWGIVCTFTKGLKEKEKTALFIFLWLLVPVARVTMPNAGIYGGVRQIMEFIPPLAILSGIGASYLWNVLHKHIPTLPKALLTSLFVLSFVPITLKLISIHPNENVYFNPLIGGLQGAKARNFPDWGTTLGSVYQQGVDWINIHAQKEADLALVKGLLSNIPRTKLRPDINFFNEYYSGDKKKGEYLMEVTDYRWVLDIPKEKRDYIDTLIPVYEVKVDNVAILTIWKNDWEHTRHPKKL